MLLESLVIAALSVGNILGGGDTRPAAGAIESSTLVRASNLQDQFEDIEKIDAARSDRNDDFPAEEQRSVAKNSRSSAVKVAPVRAQKLHRSIPEKFASKMSQGRGEPPVIGLGGAFQGTDAVGIRRLQPALGKDHLEDLHHSVGSMDLEENQFFLAGSPWSSVYCSDGINGARGEAAFLPPHLDRSVLFALLAYLPTASRSEDRSRCNTSAVSVSGSICAPSFIRSGSMASGEQGSCNRLTGPVFFERNSTPGSENQHAGLSISRGASVRKGKQLFPFQERRDLANRRIAVKTIPAS